MIAWLELSPDRKRQILTTISERTGLPEQAIEKDWWVTLALQAAFSTPWEDHLVFKGGTSLSKAWNLIERFSEDIDLALDRSVLDFGNLLSKGDVKRLKRAASDFMSGPFRERMEQALLALGVPSEQFRLTARPTDQPDLDPRMLEMHYDSVVTANDYIESRVLIEIGARSLREPCSPREITSIIGAELPGQPFSGTPFSVQTVDPKRTFLEKVFLLHEIFYPTPIKTLPNRQTRHLYDLEKLMDTPHADAALADQELYVSIVQHRENLTPVRGIGYDRHSPDKINFIPPLVVFSQWETDYTAMRQMIHGPSLSFRVLITRLKELRWRFRAVQPIALPMGLALDDIIHKAEEQVRLENLQRNVGEGGLVSVQVFYNLNIYQPSGPQNTDRCYQVDFTVSDGKLVGDDVQVLPMA